MLTNKSESRKPTIEPLLSIRDVAAILQVSTRGVERLRSSGKFPRQDLSVRSIATLDA